MFQNYNSIYQYNKLNIKNKFKLFKKKNTGRCFNGKVINFSIGRLYNKLSFIKIKLIKQILQTPCSLRVEFKKKFKITLQKIILGGCLETTLPILKKKPIGYLFYKNYNNDFINTLLYFVII